MNNIIRRFWNQYSMVNIEDLRGSAFQTEDGGHTFEITGLDADGNVTALSGTVSAVFIRPDDTNVALTGSVSNGKAYVTLTDQCYGYPGRFGLTIFLTSGGQKVAIYAAIGSVHRTNGGSVTPETTQTIEDLIAEIEAAVALIPPDYSALTAAVDSIPGTYRIPYGVGLDTGKWAATAAGTYNYYVPVSAGEVLHIRSNNSYSTFFALLKSMSGMTSGGNADFSSSYQAVQRVNPGTEQYVSVPGDAHYLFIFAADSNYIPFIFEISEYNELISMRENISKLYKRTNFFHQNGIYNAYDTTTLVEGYVIGEDGQPVQTAYTTQYAYTDYIPVSFGDVVHLAYVRGRDLNGGALYDENHNFIRTIWGTETWTKPDTNISTDFTFVVDCRNVAYIRYNVQMATVFSRGKQYIWIEKSPVYENLGKTIYVGSGKEFTTILSASKYIMDHNITNATVYVLAGTYDLVDEFGATFLTNYVDDRYSGIQFGLGAHWIFSEGAYLTFNYDGTNVNVANYFSPLVVSGSCKLENMDIEVTNCQYCIHDDWNIRVSNFIVEYKNCTMKHNGNTVGTYTTTVCIGGGLLPEELVVVDGGRYECPSSFNYPISYHSIWANLPASHPSKIIFKNIWISGGFRLQDADWDCNDVEVIITNCSQGAAIGGTHTFFEITEWNNIIRS